MCEQVCVYKRQCVTVSTGWFYVTAFFFSPSFSPRNSLGYVSNEGKVHSSGLLNKRALCGGFFFNIF